MVSEHTLAREINSKQPAIKGRVLTTLPWRVIDINWVSPWQPLLPVAMLDTVLASLSRIFDIALTLIWQSFDIASHRFDIAILFCHGFVADTLHWFDCATNGHVDEMVRICLVPHMCTTNLAPNPDLSRPSSCHPYLSFPDLPRSTYCLSFIRICWGEVELGTTKLMSFGHFFPLKTWLSSWPVNEEQTPLATSPNLCWRKWATRLGATRRSLKTSQTSKNL